MRAADSRDLVGLAALVAAALVTLAALVLLLLAGSDEFADSLGDRIRLATGELRLLAPLLLGAGLVAGTGRTGGGAPTTTPLGPREQRLVAGIAQVVAVLAAVLLLFRLLVDVFGQVEGGGGAARASAVLLDVASLVVLAAVAATWARRRTASAVVPGDGPTPP